MRGGADALVVVDHRLLVVVAEEDRGELVAVAVLRGEFGETVPIPDVELDLGVRELAVQFGELVARRHVPNDGVVVGAPHELRGQGVSTAPARRMRVFAECDVEHHLGVVLAVDVLEQWRVRLGEPSVDLQQPDVVGRLVPEELDVER